MIIPVTKLVVFFAQTILLPLMWCVGNDLAMSRSKTLEDIFTFISGYLSKENTIPGCHHSSVDSSAPFPCCCPGFESQQQRLLFYQFILELCHVEIDKNKQKETGIGPFKKRKTYSWVH